MFCHFPFFYRGLSPLPSLILQSPLHYTGTHISD
jgi:hypothetical protein